MEIDEFNMGLYYFGEGFFFLMMLDVSLDERNLFY